MTTISNAAIEVAAGLGTETTLNATPNAALNATPNAPSGGPGPTVLRAAEPAPRLTFDAYYELVSFYARYAAALDQGDWDAWPEFFLDECIYKVVPRENHERALPLAVMDFESKGMLKDRVYGIKETLFFDPYYQRHIVGLPLVHAIRGNLIEAEANYVVVRTKTEEIGDVYNVGRYLDRIRQTSRGFRLESRLCVYDSEMISNSLIYPI